MPPCTQLQRMIQRIHHYFVHVALPLCRDSAAKRLRRHSSLQKSFKKAEISRVYGRGPLNLNKSTLCAVHTQPPSHLRSSMCELDSAAFCCVFWCPCGWYVHRCIVRSSGCHGYSEYGVSTHAIRRPDSYQQLRQDTRQTSCVHLDAPPRQRAALQWGRGVPARFSSPLPLPAAPAASPCAL